MKMVTLMRLMVTLPRMTCLLRIKVIGGGDGSGAVTLDIVQSTEGIAIYMIPNDRR